MLSKRFLAVCLVAFGLTGTAFAAENVAQSDVKLVSKDGAIVFIGGVGYTFLHAEERAYDGSGNRRSELFWKSDAPVLTGTLQVRFAGAWTLETSATVGFTGNGYMDDYDWLDTSPSLAFDDWSDHSWHPDTDLDHYFTADIALGRDFEVNDAVVVNLHGGFKYTDVKWTAYGGSYVYSENGGFRNYVGSSPASERGITYQQIFPGAFIGAKTTATHNAWTFTFQARGGLIFNAKDEDHHWQRSLRFEDEFGTLPFVSLSGQIEYVVTERAKLFLAGNFEQYFDEIGDTRIYDINTGALIGSSQNGAGLEFRSLTVSGGFIMRF